MNKHTRSGSSNFEKQSFNNSENEQYFYREEDSKNKEHRKVRGPCYITGKYRGAADCICNILKLFSEKIKQNEWNENK